MSITYPRFIKITKAALEEFYWCEYGAHEDDIKDISGLTTCTILERHKNQIEVRDAKEAAQVSVASATGTFQNFFPKVSERISEELRECPEALAIEDAYDIECRKDLARMVSEAFGYKS